MSSQNLFDYSVYLPLLNWNESTVQEQAIALLWAICNDKLGRMHLSENY